jgi:hypothetical protein
VGNYTWVVLDTAFVQNYGGGDGGGGSRETTPKAHCLKLLTELVHCWLQWNGTMEQLEILKVQNDCTFSCSEIVLWSCCSM